MPPVITSDETNSKDFQARLLAARDESTRIRRAVCTCCDWAYEPDADVHELLFLSHAAGHSYKGNHEIRFEALDGSEVRL